MSPVHAKTAAICPVISLEGLDPIRVVVLAAPLLRAVAETVPVYVEPELSEMVIVPPVIRVVTRTGHP